jgi:hypothetical protein
MGTGVMGAKNITTRDIVGVPRSSGPQQDAPAGRARFEQAKKPTKNPQFLQIVAKPKPTACRKSEPKLTRVAFKVSRLMEFCSERELQNQTGHALYDWPLVVGKEVVDNALDACEEAEVAPDITVIVDPGTIIIQDNAGGIDTNTIESILDYTIRVSSREAYVSPTRGAQGNALKTILAMGYVLDRKIGSDADAAGITIIETRGTKHQIEFRVDHINNQPKIIHITAESPVKVGTKLTIKWPPKLELLESVETRFKQLNEGYVWFNPHLTLRGVWFGDEFIDVQATNPVWEKWRPCNPTSPHWYDESRLQRYFLRTWPGIATSGSTTRCERSSASSVDSLELPFSAKYWRRLAAPINRWRSSSAWIRSTARASPSCYWRCGSTASPLLLSILASSASSISSSGSWRQAATVRPSSIIAARV